MGIGFFLGTQTKHILLNTGFKCLFFFFFFVIILYSALFAFLIALFFNLEDSENYKRKQNMIGKSCNTAAKGCCFESNITHYCPLPLRLVRFLKISVENVNSDIL